MVSMWTDYHSLQRWIERLLTSPGRNIWYTRIKATVKKATNDDENDGDNDDNNDDDDNDGVPFARRSSQSPAKYRLSTIVG